MEDRIMGAIFLFKDWKTKWETDFILRKWLRELCDGLGCPVEK